MQSSNNSNSLSNLAKYLLVKEQSHRAYNDVLDLWRIIYKLCTDKYEKADNFCTVKFIIQNYQLMFPYHFSTPILDQPILPDSLLKGFSKNQIIINELRSLKSVSKSQLCLLTNLELQFELRALGRYYTGTKETLVTRLYECQKKNTNCN